MQIYINVFSPTDIPLLPSIMSLSLNENEEDSGPFVVHWLNNKELHFTLSMEVFLQHLKKNFEHISSEASTEESNQMDMKSDEGKHMTFCSVLKPKYLKYVLPGICLKSNLSCIGVFFL